METQCPIALVPARQVHLDFHTSEYIPDIARDFDERTFAQTFADAHVNSVTVFAVCHHGWLYYPSEAYPDWSHPQLVHKDLLLRQVRALHAAGIRAPVYIAVQWARQIAKQHPEWLIVKRDGSHEGDVFDRPGFYQSLCVNTPYREVMHTITREVCELLGDDLDGLFFDICSIRPCLCPQCRQLMEQEGYDPRDDVQVRRFAALTMDRFKAEMTAYVRRFAPGATIFYNSGHVGPCTKESAKDNTHFEIESLPSGVWGYLHFPIVARYAHMLGKDCVGMTGKFHTSWGDFHSLKNRAALEFECFRMLSYGCACSIGDQMEPRGTLDPATYRHIGRIYERIAGLEQYARPSKLFAEEALITSESPLYEQVIPDSILGAAQLLDELALQYTIIDAKMPFDGFRLLILPEDLTVDADFAGRLNAYVANGGAVLACGKAALRDDAYPECFGAAHQGEEPLFPDFLIPEGPLAGGLESDTRYVMYMQGQRIAPTQGHAVLQAVAPYFSREGDHFCSHQHAPLDPKSGPHAAAVQNGSCILFGNPLFSQYRQNAPAWCRLLIQNAIDRLLGHRAVQHNGPSTLLVTVLDQPEQDRYCVHLLHYVPIRKTATIDVIEEPTPIYGLQLQLDLPGASGEVEVVSANAKASVEKGRITLDCMPDYVVLAIQKAKE